MLTIRYCMVNTTRLDEFSGSDNRFVSHIKPTILSIRHEDHASCIRSHAAR